MDRETGLRRCAGREREAWRRLDDEAAHVAAALRAARSRAQAARQRAAERRERGEQARLAGQEAFAVGLLDAAEAHELAARQAEESTAHLDARHRELRREADARRAAAVARRGCGPGGCRGCAGTEVG